MWAMQSWRVQQGCWLVCKTFPSSKENPTLEKVFRHTRLGAEPVSCIARFSAQTLEQKANEFKIGNACSDSLSRYSNIVVNLNHGEKSHALLRLRDEEFLEQSFREESQAFSISKTVACSVSSRSIKLEELLLFLESIGVDEMKIMAKYPSIVDRSLQEVKSIANYLERTGLKRKELGRVINMSPQILERNVEGHLKPTVKFLIEEVGLSKDRLPKAINRCPRLLVCGLDEQLRHTMRFLKSLGFKGMEWVVSSNPALLTFSIQKRLVPKLQFLQSLGITHEEAVGMVIRLPAIFNYSLEGNLRVKHEYLINVMRRDLHELCCFPQFFAFSLDHRIRPRHEFLSKHNVRLSLPTMLKLGNKEFSAMFTKGAPKYTMTHDGFFLE